MAKSSKDNSTGSGKHLVIVESPAKAKTINKYLGSDYVVKASMGHVRDLPSRNPKGVKAPVPGVDIEHDFKPTYEALGKGKKTLAGLRKLAKDAPMVYLATDLDREGEAIAWHIAEALKLTDENTERVVFNEITKSAIQEAFQHPRKVNMDMVNAQQARRILDRIVGYQVSPLLWKKVAGGLSAGRVQSVALRLVVEREREIDAFDPQEYWRIEGVFSADVALADTLGQLWDEFVSQTDEKGNGPTKVARQKWLSDHDAFSAELSQVGGEKFAADNADVITKLSESLGLTISKVVDYEDPKGRKAAKFRKRMICTVDPTTSYAISGMKEKETKRRPYAPFTTAALQQAASSFLGMSPRRTMRIAQSLYEGMDVPGVGTVGLITYMRTDSRHLSAEAVSACRQMIEKKFGDTYLPEKPNVYSSGGRAQEAHEAIRPTDANLTPAELKSTLSDEQFRLYDLIWRRFVSCQMTPAIWNNTEVLITGGTDDAITFRTTGRSLVFDGYLRVAGVNTAGDPILPALEVGQPVGPMQVKPIQLFTQPPARYTEASLVKALESENIGRPSTYAAILQTIMDRNYVDREGRALRPTDLGVVVCDKLIEAFPDIFQVKFTAHMEDDLDKVEDATMDWVAVLHEFYGPFKARLDVAAENMTHAKAETQPSDFDCPECGAKMEYRFGKNGKFLSCTKYPDCKAAMPIDRDGNPTGVQTTDVACPLCGKPTVLRKGRFGPFLSCGEYPECKGIVKLDKKGNVKLPSAPPLGIDMPCEKCGGDTMNLRRGKRGPWISCAKYPKCRGRAAWKPLDDELKKKLEADLEAHEAANPQPPIKSITGELLPEGHTPVITEEKPATPPRPKAEASDK